LWCAGVYGLSREGHERFGEFPDVTGDDLFVDSQFIASEKAVVAAQPSVWTTPTHVGGLITVLTRHHRGNVELASNGDAPVPLTAKATALAILRTVRGPRSTADATVYIGTAIAARMARWLSRRRNTAWERDDSSRSPLRQSLDPI
jgi:hypothetical protein